jgi:sugar O-acyltransferase (sialic acid O-acetyltransferase NeuD family)
MSSTRERQQLVILGAGSFAEEVADLAAATQVYEPVAFVEGADRDRCGRHLAGLPVVWIDDAGALADSCQAVCAVGTPKREHLIRQALAAGLRFATVVHPGAHVSATAALGAGTIVNAGAVIAAHSTLGEHVIVNRGGLIGHHVTIGAFTTISPGANIAGRGRIGSQCYIGMGAIVLDGRSIGDAAVVGAGAVVTHDVAPRALVLGAPARVAKDPPPS